MWPPLRDRLCSLSPLLLLGVTWAPRAGGAGFAELPASPAVCLGVPSVSFEGQSKAFQQRPSLRVPQSVSLRISAHSELCTSNRTGTSATGPSSGQRSERAGLALTRGPVIS